MMFDRPGLILYTTCATAGPLAGVALARWIGPGPDTLLAQIAASALTALVISVHIAADYDEHKRVNGDNPKPKVNEPQSPRTIPNLNAVYEFQGQTVRLDHRRHFFILLWRQYEYDPEQVDLTEEYWLRNQPRKWKGKDSEFRELKHECDGVIFERKDPNRRNSGYVIRNERALHYAASHGVLPH